MAVYETISVLAFAGALVWTCRSGDPLCLGALLCGTLLFGFDWFWCGRGFFNATFAPNLMPIPGLHILGQSYPIAVALNWGVGFGFAPYLIARHRDGLRRRLGAFHFPIVFMAAGLIDLAIEVPLVSGLGVYTYHQAPRWLFQGVPWSNFWFGGGLIALSYFGLAYARRWASPLQSGFSVPSETFWKGFLMAAAALWSAFYLMTVLQLFWYSAAAPWVESGRPF